MTLVFMYIQHTFQVVLSTDERSTFATFIYEDPVSVRQISRPFQIGLSAGDGSRFLNILPDSIQSTNTFRIDGKHASIHT